MQTVETTLARAQNLVKSTIYAARDLAVRGQAIAAYTTARNAVRQPVFGAPDPTTHIAPLTGTQSNIGVITNGVVTPLTTAQAYAALDGGDTVPHTGDAADLDEMLFGIKAIYLGLAQSYPDPKVQAMLVAMFNDGVPLPGA